MQKISFWSTAMLMFIKNNKQQYDFILFLELSTSASRFGMEQFGMDASMGCFSLHVPASPTPEQMDFLGRLLACTCIMQNAGPSIQILVDPKFKTCLDNLGADLATEVADGILIPYPLEECIDGDQEDIETFDDFIEAVDLGTVICLQVCGDWYWLIVTGWRLMAS